MKVGHRAVGVHPLSEVFLPLGEELPYTSCKRDKPSPEHGRTGKTRAMVSNFALALSFEGIALLRRVGSSWARIEEVPIDHPDLDVAVIAMRDRAEKLDPKGAEVAIVIPTEQIRFLDLPDFGGDASARDVAIRAALDGATPYPLSALAYDHALVGGRLQIAAVARETLDEAETFAKEHGFTPVCHLAQAPDGAFDGAVYFGKARTWKRAADRPSRAIEIVPATEAALTPVSAAAPAPRKPDPVAAPEPLSTPEMPDHVAAELPEARNMAPVATKPVAATKDDAPALPLRDEAPVHRAPANFAPATDEEEAAALPPSGNANHAVSEPETARAASGDRTIPASAAPDMPREAAMPPAMPVLPDVDAPARPEPVATHKTDAAPQPSDSATDAAPAEAAPVAFASSRTLRADGRVPPAPRPNLVPSTDVPPRRARFTPLATPEMRTRDSHVTSDHIEGLPDLKPAAMPMGRAPEASKPQAQATPPAPGTPLTARTDETTIPAGTLPLPAAPAPRTDEPALAAASRPVGPAGDRQGGTPARALGAPSHPDANNAAPTLGAAGRADADTPARPLGVPSRPEAGTTAPTLGAASPQTGEAPRFGSALPRTTSKSEGEARPKAPKKSGLRLGRKDKRSAPATDRPAFADPAPQAAAAEAPAKRKSGLRLSRRDKTPAPAPTPANVAAPAVAVAASGASPLARLAALRAPDAVPPAAARVAKLAKVTAAPERIPPAPTGAALSPLKIQPDPEAVDDLPLPVAKPMARTAPNIAPVTPGKPALERDRRSQMSQREERDRMTVFGAREQQAVGGKPRFLGLMLTAGLLLFLVGVAAWASVFLEDGLARFFRGQDEPTAVAALPDPVATEDPTVSSSATPEATASDQTGTTAGTETEPEAQEDTVELAAAQPEPADTADAPAPRSTPVPARALTPEEADATYAATGIWQRSPASPLTPPDDGVENVYVASIDPSVRMFDAVALPEAPDLLSQPVPVDPGLPPPAGMTFDIDERGVVRATPEGALTPDGLRVYTGPPPVVPPLRNPPVELAALPGPDTPVTTDAPDAPDTPDAAPAVTDPLSDFRPEARPDDVVEQQERATLGGISLQELEEFRPLARPRTAQEEAVEEEPSSPATDLAVRNSLEPVGRPRNMSAIVERAERERPTEPVQTAAVAPRVVAPSVPSSASVASSATVRNAINLSRINLIGVYGTPANRRALVRLASGKYLKVKVGDKLDGGRVAAIGDSELQYTKGGRNVTLQMPRG